MTPIYRDRGEAVSQGDLFADVTFRAPTETVMAGMVISEDCDCDKFLKPRTPIPEDEKEHWCITVAPVHPISALTGGRPRAVREGEMARYFLLPAEGQQNQELVADLWLEQPVPMLHVMSRRRLTCLSDEWRRRLHAQLWYLRTRIPLDQVGGAGYAS